MDWASGLQGIFTVAEPDQSLMYIDQPLNSGSFIMSHSQDNYDLSNLQTSENRIVFVDEHGNLHQGYQDFGLLAESFNIDDDEIPPHTLDHMYAKKPREPGTEQTTKPRRRSKKKEQVVEPQYLMPDPIPQTPKINIIRQRLPSSVYKSLSPSRPKILQGGSPTKSLTGGSQSPSGSSPRKEITGRNTFGSSSRSGNKEDPSFTNYGEDSKSSVTKGLGFGNGSKLAKEQQSLSKNVKPFSSKVNSNSILMDDLHKQEPEYEEEMLFDFGIAEDEDEVNRCALSSEEFNDVVFGECEFGGSLEPYPMSSQNTCNKGLTTTRLPNSSSSQRFYKKTGLSTAATLGSGMSDDDDSNQIMVPMGNRRKSRDWDSIEKVEEPIEVKIEKSIDSQVIESFNTENNKSIDTLSQVSTGGPSETLEPKQEYITSDSPNETLHVSTKTAVNNSDNKSPSSISKDSSQRSKATLPAAKNKRSSSSSTPPKASSPFKPVPEPTRRSVRAVRAPARLDDIDDSVIRKKRR